MNAANQLFGQQTLEFLIRKDIQFNKDTTEASYFYFKNGFIEVTKDDDQLEGLQAIGEAYLGKANHQNEIMQQQ